MKTKASRLILPLIGLAKDALLIHRARTVQPSSHVIFTAPKGGGLVNPQSFTRAFQRACMNAGLRATGPHAMRHTVATLLKNLSVPARDAQLILGHSNIITTQQIYQHDDLATRREALERLEGKFRHDGNAASEEESALPSKLPSPLTSSLDRQQEKTPSWRLHLYKFFGDPTGNRTRIARMKTWCPNR